MSKIDFKFNLKLCAIFVLVITILYLTFVLVASIPNERIKDKMLESAEMFTSFKTFEFEDGNKINSAVDNYADSILLNISYNVGKGNPFYSVLNTGYYNGEEVGLYYGLYTTILENNPPNIDYARYWHGNSMFVRLFHTFTDINGMRNISFYIILGLLLITLILLVVKKYYFIAFALLVSFLAVQFKNISYSLEYQSPFTVCFILLPFYILFEKKYDKSLFFLSVISGTMVAFFDFLTTETITILIPLILVLAIRAREKRLKDTKNTIILVVKCLLLWGISYGLTFLSKWFLASVVTGRNVFATALSSVAERIAGNTEAVTIKPPATVFSSVISNIAAPFGSVIREDYTLALTGAVAFLAVFILIWAILKTKTPNKNVSLVILSLGTLVLLRYMILNNHSFIHCFFTYRALASLIFSALIVLWLNSKLFYMYNRKKRRKRK